MFTVILEGLEFANMVYKGREGVDMIMEYVRGPLFIRYFVLQFGFGALLPIAVMGILIARNVHGRAFVIGAAICALLVLMNVLMMRWNVVIGGQAFSLSFSGYMHYEIPVIPHSVETFKEGVFGALTVIATPFVLFWIINKFVPSLRRDVEGS